MAKVTATIGREHYTTIIQSGHHQIVSDEPVEEGGTDAGCTPDELLAAALSACTNITLRMYADRKSWPLDAVEVEIIMERDPKAKTTSFLRKIKFIGPLDEEQTSQLLEIADKCPIHQALSHPISIQTTLWSAESNNP